MSLVSQSVKAPHRPRIETVSTTAQQATDAEVQPFFVNLNTLPRTQLDHLRESGLLCATKNEEEDGVHPLEEDDNPKEDESHDYNHDICLVRDKHVRYLSVTWQIHNNDHDNRPQLRTSFISLDASRPWMLYWTAHACDLLGHAPNAAEATAMIATLEACFTTVSNIQFPATLVQGDPVLQQIAQLQGVDINTNNNTTNEITLTGGGFGGGPGQLPHAATTYGAVLCLVLLMGQRRDNYAARSLLTRLRAPLYVWMRSLQVAPYNSGATTTNISNTNSGSFVMHHDGEPDVRATYCVWAVARLLGLGTAHLLSKAAIDYVSRCQTYEGGFGGEPGCEAHGGYTFCATAALVLSGAGLHGIDVDALTAWLTRRQEAYAGGFNGRANKLVDGCYSFWQGSAMALVSYYHALQSHNTNDERALRCGPTLADDPWLSHDSGNNPPYTMLMDEGMLERYILLCGQDVNGGLRDKPSKRRDFYHSCYCLSGLAVAQASDPTAYGHPTLARVHATHPVYNLRLERVQAALACFGKMPVGAW